MRKLAVFASLPTLLGLLAGMPAAGPLFAQAHATQALDQRRAGFSPAELDQMLAPIALYPDALLSQLLIATTYWPEVAEAARFSLEHPELSGEDALRAVEAWSWHPSVKSLLALPQLLAMMGQRPDWVARLGDAFLVQQSRVMDSIQMLRQRALAAGSLQSNTLISVVQQGPATLLLSPDPQLIYMPWYNANLVYGRWWWPSHPPLVWTAWSGGFGPRTYAPGVYPHVVALPTRLFVATFDWHRRAARMAHAERTLGIAHAPHVSPPAPAHRAGDGRLPLPGSNFTAATAAHAGARPTLPIAGSLPHDGRRHHPLAGSGQPRPTPAPTPAAAVITTPVAAATIATPVAATIATPVPAAAITAPVPAAAITAPMAAAAITTPVAAAAITTPVAAAAVSVTRDQFNAQRARQPEVATAPATQAAPAAPGGQNTGTALLGQAPLGAAHREERRVGMQRHEPLAQAPRAETAAHGFRTEPAAGIQRIESSGQPHSLERTSMHPGGVPQVQRPQTIVPAIAVAARPAAAPAPASAARPPGKTGDSQHRAPGPR